MTDHTPMQLEKYYTCFFHLLVNGFCVIYSKFERLHYKRLLENAHDRGSPLLKKHVTKL